MIVLGDVVLRRFEPSDLEHLLRYRNDWNVTQSLGGFSVGFSRAEMKQWMQLQKTARDRMLWAIATRQGNRCIGHVGLYQLDPRVGKAEFAIFIGDRRWHGKGVGRSATAAVLQYGFEQMNLHKIWLTVLNTNTPALRLYRALGFVKEGVLRDEQFRNGRYVDVTVMSILSPEWRRRQRKKSR
jgi:ribosomal-protein-alanine N-acetyltransferase